MNTPFYPMASTATDVVMQMARKNVEYWDYLSEQASGTPAAPLFEVASQIQHTAYQNFEALTGVLNSNLTDGAAGKTTTASKSEAKAKPAAAAKKAPKDPIKSAKPEAAAPAEQSDAVTLYDDLTAVQGIGPATMRKLHDAGIRSIADLAETQASALSEILENANIRVLKYSPKDWIKDAKRLLKAAA